MCKKVIENLSIYIEGNHGAAYKLKHICKIGIITMFGSSLPAVVCRRSHVLFTLFLFVLVFFFWGGGRIVVSNTYCVVFLFCFFVLCTLMLPVSLDFPFLIAPSVFSNVYLLRQMQRYWNKGNIRIWYINMYYLAQNYYV